jgi:hypothetical protein
MVALRAVCAALLCLAAALSRSGTARADEAPVVLHPFVWEGYQEYSDLRHPSAFAVSRDGSAYGYSYCPERRCKFNTDKKVALESCAENGGEDCMIFAIERDIQVAYQVLDLTRADGCPTPASSQNLLEIAVVPDIDDVVYDHSHGIAELTELEKRGKTRVDPVDFELLGLTMHGFSMGEIGSGTTLVRGTAGETCVGMADGKIHVRMISTIHVASEFPESSCLYREILGHEEKHQAVGRRLFRELAAHATRLLRADLRQQPYVRVADAGMAAAVAQARIEAAIVTAYESFWQHYDTEQDRIDTPQEYARVVNACPDAGQYLD